MKRCILSDESLDLLDKNKKLFDLLMSYYRCAVMEMKQSLEYQTRNIPEDEAKLIAQELYDCSVESAKLDERMQKIRTMMNKGES